MGSNSDRFDLEWLVVQKRFIYIVVAVILAALAAGAGFYLWTHGSPFNAAGDEAATASGARFDSFEGDVRVVRAETRETVQVRNDTRLFPGDVVQTQADGRARISLVDGSAMTIGPNSVITIADNTSAGDGRRTNVRVAVDRGQIKVRTEQQAEGTTNIVETPLTKNTLAAQTAASFGVNENKTEELRVSQGSLKTSTRGGEETTLRENEFVALTQSGAIRNRERLLDVPLPVTPRNMERIPARSGGAANVALRWQRPASGTPAHYRVEVGTSPFFVATGKVIERDQLVANEFDIGDLRPGNYFWHVRAVATSQQVSEWSEAQKFIVVSGEASGGQVRLTEVKAEYIAGSIYLVRGQTQPGTTVRHAGREVVASADGKFQLQINAPQGAREIVLEVEDQHGNKSNYQVAVNAGATPK